MSRRSILIATSSLVVAFSIWFWTARSVADALQTELGSLRAVGAGSVRSADAEARSKAAEDAAQLDRQIAEMREAVTREEAALRAVKKSVEETRAKIPPIEEGEVVVSFGRIADMGKEAGQAVRGIAALMEGKGMGDGTTSLEQTQASFMKLVAWMPEIAGFEQQPEEMAEFQTSVFRELFALDEARTKQVKRVFAMHFAALRSSGLTAADSSQPNWKERRSAALVPLLWQLRPYLPEADKSSALVANVVNIGAGLETKTETHFSPIPGKSSHTVSMTLASWPRLPWLPDGKSPAPR